MSPQIDPYITTPFSASRLLVLALILLPMAGCSRGVYRCRADREAYSLVNCASTDPRWPLQGFTIDPNPESRMFDPDNPDCPPMPPDDPTSHLLMHCVDCQKGRCKKGWPHWNAFGRTPYVENPVWQSYLPRDENGVVSLNREGVVRVSLLHSPEYQRELENLYLSALDVSFERFQFDTQFFGGNSNTFLTAGPISGQAGSATTHTIRTPLGFSRAFATGGQLAAEVANRVVWSFSGQDSYSVTTPITFVFTQPLLRFAGRAIVLEDLTSSERALLADVRRLVRFHRGFYLQVVTGGGGAPGMLSLLEQQVVIRNEQFNIAGLQDSLDQIQAAFDAGRLDNRLQVDQALQSLLRAQSGLLATKNRYDNDLDSYKIGLGLPPDLELQVEDPLLNPFNLIGPDLDDTRTALVAVLRQLRDPDEEVPADYVQRLATLAQASLQQLTVVQQDMQLLDEALPARRETLQSLASREEVRTGAVDPEACSIPALEDRAAGLKEEFGAIAQALQDTLAELDAFEYDQVDTSADAIAAAEASPSDIAAEAAPATPLKRLTDLVDRFSTRLLQLSLIQAIARLDTVTLVPVDLGSREAFEIARVNRIDWMNERAELVDQWRQIQVAANRLRSDLDVDVRGDLTPRSNTGSNTHNTTGQIQVGLQFDAPVTRLIERNAYRNTLINYQRARRDYYTFEDVVNRDLRDILRTLRLSQLNFELTRAGVLVAITKVDISRLALRKPAAIGARGGLGDTASRDVLDALRDLLASQNNFLREWVDYEILRMNLDFDLGTMRLDDRGVWIDPGPVDRTMVDRHRSPEQIVPEPELFPAPPPLAEPET